MVCNGESIKKNQSSLFHFCDASLKIHKLPKHLENKANCAIKIVLKKKGGKVLRDVELLMRNKDGVLKVLTSNLFSNKENKTDSSLLNEIPPGIDKNFFDTLTKEQKEQRDNLLLPFMEKQSEELVGELYDGKDIDNDEFDEEKWEDFDD
jgi:hypothetical protein